MATGTVRWFNEEKGYGFIAPDDGSREAFVHYSEIQAPDIQKTLVENQRVAFELTKDHRGRPRAIKVKAFD